MVMALVRGIRRAWHLWVMCPLGKHERVVVFETDSKHIGRGPPRRAKVQDFTCRWCGVHEHQEDEWRTRIEPGHVYNDGPSAQRPIPKGWDRYITDPTGELPDGTKCMAGGECKHWWPAQPIASPQFEFDIPQPPCPVCNR